MNLICGARSLNLKFKLNARSSTGHFPLAEKRASFIMKPLKLRIMDCQNATNAWWHYCCNYGRRLARQRHPVRTQLQPKHRTPMNGCGIAIKASERCVPSRSQGVALLFMNVCSGPAEGGEKYEAKTIKKRSDTLCRQYSALMELSVIELARPARASRKRPQYSFAVSCWFGVILHTPAAGKLLGLKADASD